MSKKQHIRLVIGDDISNNSQEKELDDNKFSTNFVDHTEIEEPVIKESEQHNRVIINNNSSKSSKSRDNTKHMQKERNLVWEDTNTVEIESNNKSFNFQKWRNDFSSNSNDSSYSSDRNTEYSFQNSKVEETTISFDDSRVKVKDEKIEIWQESLVEKEYVARKSPDITWSRFHKLKEKMCKESDNLRSQSDINMWTFEVKKMDKDICAEDKDIWSNFIHVEVDQLSTDSSIWSSLFNSRKTYDFWRNSSSSLYDSSKSSIFSDRNKESDSDSWKEYDNGKDNNSAIFKDRFKWFWTNRFSNDN